MSAGFPSGILGVPSSLCKGSASGRVVLTWCLLAFPWWFLLDLRPGVTHTLSCVQGHKQEPTASSCPNRRCCRRPVLCSCKCFLLECRGTFCRPPRGCVLLTHSCWFELLPAGLPCRSFAGEHRGRSRAWANARRVSGERSARHLCWGRMGPSRLPLTSVLDYEEEAHISGRFETLCSSSFLESKT